MPGWLARSPPSIIQQQAATSTSPAETAVRPQDRPGYYSGMLTSDLRQDNGSGAGDMLKRSLQLAGGAAALLAVLLLGFLSSNGLV